MAFGQFVQHLIDAISLGSLYALFALGLAMVFSVMGLINFAHSELIMFGAYSMVLFAPLPWQAALPLAIVIPVVCAVAMERVAFRPLRGASPSTLLVTSFAVSYFLQNLAGVMFSYTPRTGTLPPVFVEVFALGTFTVSKLSVIVVATTAALLLGLAAFLTRTTMGVQIRAAAEDFPMARVLGVHANRVIAVAFALSGLLAGVAGIFIIGQTGSASPTLGVNALVLAFVATILGGMGSLTGAVLGGLILGALTVFLQVVLPVELRPFRDAFTFALVILMLLARPDGLIVAKARTKRV